MATLIAFRRGCRHSPHDLLVQIINPSKEVTKSLPASSSAKTTAASSAATTSTSPTNQRVNIDLREVKSIELSKVYPKLIAMLKKHDIIYPTRLLPFQWRQALGNFQDVVLNLTIGTKRTART